MADEGFLLTLVTVPDCEPCDAARDLVQEFVRSNRALEIDVRWIDGVDDAREVVRRSVTEHPTLLLDVHGDERLRLTGAPFTRRKLLRRLLPLVYHDDRVALARLREQLGSPTEDFPTGPRRGRVRQAERLELLRSIPLFDGLNRRQLTQLAKLADEILREPGDVLTEEGQQGDEFFVVAAGSVAVSKRGRRVAVLGAGDHFGEMSLLDDGPRSATVVATAPTTLLAIHRSDFDRHLLRSPAVMRSLLTNLSRRLR